MTTSVPSAAVHRFDPELIRRYECHGPRYTSYPTAPHFHTGFDVGAYRKAAFLSNDPAAPLSIYAHIPFCASPCFYCGCNKVITRSRSEGERYVAALKSEIELQAALFHHERLVEQLHFGGGTPTFLSLGQLESILAHLDREFAFAPKARREWSIEIDPRTVSGEAMAGLARLGFNRVSLGIQDFDPTVQRAVNRIQSIEQTQQILDGAREHGIHAINFDLIYGLPLQTAESFARTLDTVIAMRPTRVAAYGYAHMPQQFKPQRRIKAEQLPSSAERLELLRLTIDRLSAAGYLYIGMDHFALPEDPLAKALLSGQLHRNFQGYSSQPDCDLIGLGVSAISRVGSAYAQNTKTLHDYYERIDQHRLAVNRGLSMSSDDRVRRDVIQALMCRGMLDIATLEQEHCIEFKEYFATELTHLTDLERDKLVEVTDCCIRISDEGRFLVRNVAMVFDAYLQPHASHTFSRVM